MQRYLAIALRVALGAVFTFAAYSKLRQPWTIFAMSIDSYQILPEWAVLGVAQTLPWAELALGVLLAAGLWLRFTSVAGSGLLTIVVGTMLVAYVRGLSVVY